MQMKALRSANFAKLSSSNSTSDVYWDTSISAGTPDGYCLSQMRSMVFPLWFGPRFLGRDALFGAVLSNAAAGGERLFASFWGSSSRLGIRVSNGGRLGRGLGIGFGIGLGVLPGVLAGILIRRIRLFCRNPRLLSARPRGLLFGVPGHCGNQRGAGFRRTGIDGHRLRRSGRRRQQLRRLWHRRLQSGGEEADRGLAAGWAAGRGVAGNCVLILVAGGPFAFSSAHLVAQVRRRGVDRHQTVDRAERGPQPRQRVVGKTTLEQLRRFHRPRLAGGSAKHHRDQPFAVARGGSDQVVAGRADETGLEAIGAGVTSDQLVEILCDPAAEAD